MLNLASPRWDGGGTFHMEFARFTMDGTDYYLPGKNTTSLELVREILERLTWDAGWDAGTTSVVLSASDPAAEKALGAIRAFNYGYGSHKILRKNLSLLKSMSMEELATYLCSRLVV